MKPSQDPAAVIQPRVAATASCPSRRLFVLGAGRSGTSLLAGLFRGSGLFMGAAGYLPRLANPHGFFEDREVNAINEALLAPLVPPRPASDPEGVGSGYDSPGTGQRWLARLPVSARPQADDQLQARIKALYAHGPSCFKDPRFCYTLSVWRPLIPAEDVADTGFLCVFRDPAVVLTSVLQEMQSAAYLNDLAISVEQVFSAWALQYQHVLTHHASSGRWLFLAYEQLLQSEGLDRLEAFTGHGLDRTLPEARLNRSRSRQAIPIPEPVAAIHRQLRQRAGLHPAS